MSKLSDEERIVLEHLVDHRSVSEGLENAFCTGGLREFRAFVLRQNKTITDKHHKLALLLRGNGENESVIVYKDNHKIWELSISGNYCRVSFDFNHARYTRNWSEKLDSLLKLGFELGERRKAEVLKNDGRIRIKRNANHVVIGGEIGIISSKKEDFDCEFVEQSYEIINDLVSEFFKPHTTDFFRIEVSKEYPEAKIAKGAGQNVLVEKRWQQRLFFHFNDMQNGYYAYDLEFSQRYPDAGFVKAFADSYGNQFSAVNAKNIKTKLGTNEPDMLAIRYENGEPQALVLIEVKSTFTACESETSGVKKHIEGMDRYAKQKIFMRNRKVDAYNSLSQYKRMGFINNETIIPEFPDTLEIEKVLLFTNASIPQEECSKPKESALEYLNANWADICSWAKKYGCDIWKTEDNYWNDSINIIAVPVN